MAIRKNVASLSGSERRAYVDAVMKLKSAPSQFTPKTASRYDDYVYVHMQAMLDLSIKDPKKLVTNDNISFDPNSMRMPMWAHRCPAFLPWHRELLYQFERDIQLVSNDHAIGIPYWDWSVNQTPTGIPWLEDFMGGDGADGPVTTGPFAGTTNWKLTLSEDGKDHLVRGFGLASFAGKTGTAVTFPRLPTPTEVNACLADKRYDAAPWNDAKALESFRNQLEGWYVPPDSSVADGMHNLVHLWVGGNNGTMLPSTSPNDPVFFLHHCNVDRLWATWQRMNRHTNGFQPYLPSSPLATDPGQGLDEPMIFYDPRLSATPPWSDPAPAPSTVVDHHGLGYVYDDEAIATPADLLRMREIFSASGGARVPIESRERFYLRIEDAIGRSLSSREIFSEPHTA
jgi:tyrosinase